MEKNLDIIIIGAGIAGLAAGCYGQMNGFETKIFELHDLPGGLCTAWKRKGYTFDGCIDWLLGTSPKDGFYKVWSELGAVQGREMINRDEFLRVEAKNGRTLIFYSNADRLEKHLKELAPEDSTVIEEFTKGIRAFSHMEMPVDLGFVGGLRLGLKMLPVLRPLQKYSPISIKEFGKKFKNPFLQEVFDSVFDLPDFPLMALMMALGYQHKQAAGYPIGGSLEFAQAIEQRYLSLGGHLSYQSRVVKIITENDRAVGVTLADGSQYRAKIVISAADGHATLFEMLDGKYLTDKIRSYYKELPIFQPLIQVSLGVNRNLEKEPVLISWPLVAPITIGGVSRAKIGYKHYCNDPTMAPKGKSALIVTFPSSYDYWKKLDKAQYQAEKQRIAEQVVECLNSRFPGIKEQVEVIDVATPLTYERYTGNWQGSMEGWQITTKTGNLVMSGMRKTLPGLSNFYMIGQWVQPGGGLPPAANSGRDIIKKICKQNHRKFTTKEA